MKTTSSCSAEGCNVKIHSVDPMCPKHWKMIPEAMQKEFHKRWKGPPKLCVYQDLSLRQIINRVAKREGNLVQGMIQLEDRLQSAVAKKEAK